MTPQSKSKNVYNPEQFRVIYDSCNQMVRGTIYNMVGAEPLDDLTQETFLKVWRQMKTFDERANVKTWVYRIAINSTLDYCRKQKKLSQMKMPEPVETGSSSEVAKLIQLGLDRLSYEHRAIIVMNVMDGVPLKEVAKITKTPMGTLKSRLHYARKELAKFLAEHGVRYKNE